MARVGQDDTLTNTAQQWRAIISIMYIIRIDQIAIPNWIGYFYFLFGVLPAANWDAT